MPNETETANETETETSSYDLQSLKREYFAPDSLDKAAASINDVVTGCGLVNAPVAFNFDPEDGEVADGFGLAIVPLRKRIDKQSVIYGVTIAQVPDPSTVIGSAKGEVYVRELVINTLLAKVANNSRDKADGSTGVLPVTLTDYMDKRTPAGEGMAAYNDYSSIFVKALRQKGLKLMTAQILRSCLQSASFAAEQFDKIEQETWNTIINLMIAKNEADKKDPAILRNWLDKRDELEVSLIADDVDFSDLSNLI